MKNKNHDLRPQKQRCAVFHVFDKKEKAQRLKADSVLNEAVSLASALVLDVIFTDIIGLSRANPSTLIGKGIIEQHGQVIKNNDIDLVVINHDLSPVQQRNLEKVWNVKVIDRTGLILEIFGARASTKEGRLQVELAALTFQRSRLVRSWTHLERQRGGFGFVGGPGETQIEIDRRLIDERIARIKKDLTKVVKTRTLNRQARKKVPYPVVALVGYTNAGKSTLFNYLTGAEVMAEDLLFATLDPTMREISLPNGQKVILSDTVGFISELPTMLVAAFRATLEEVLEADLILHVRDISNPESEQQKEDVEAILNDLGIDVEAADHIVEVLNKVDNLSRDQRREWIRYQKFSELPALLCSAVTGEGTGKILAEIENNTRQKTIQKQYTIPLDQGKTIAWFHRHTEVLEKMIDESQNNVILTVEAEEKYIHQFEKGLVQDG